jgi:RNA polymerase sigma-70 factor (ECF subfamily)
MAEMRAADDERRMVDACLSGEPGAWEAFVHRYASYLYSVVCQVLRRRTGSLDRNQADAVLSDVFFEMYRNDCQSLRAFSGKSKLTTYLYVIAQRKCSAALRAGAGPETPAEQAEDAVWEGPGPGGRAETEERARRVRQAVRSLPQRDARVLELFYFQGVAQSAIAEELGVPTEHAGMIVKRAREKLRKILVRQKDSLL